MVRGREIDEERRNRIMQRLFGDQWKEEDDEDEDDSEHESAIHQIGYCSNKGKGKAVVEDEDEAVEVSQPRKPSGSSTEQKYQEIIRNVFGDSDEEGSAVGDAQNQPESELHRSPGEEETGQEEDAEPEAPGENDTIEQKRKGKQVAPPLDIEVPLRQPPGPPNMMNVIRLSNFTRFEPKEFDPRTYKEENECQKDNIVRWRKVMNPDGTVSCESNARFVRWEDGSIQLLIGNEVIDTVQEAHHGETNLFLKHKKGVLQSQGKPQQRMRFMPPSSPSKSNQLLHTLARTQHKKGPKIKSHVTDVDPEKDKEEKVKTEAQRIKANEQLRRKREKERRKHPQPAGKHPQPAGSEQLLPPSILEGMAQLSSKEDLKAEAKKKKGAIKGKKSYVRKDTSSKFSLPAELPSRHAEKGDPENEREEHGHEGDAEDKQDEAEKSTKL